MKIRITTVLAAAFFVFMSVGVSMAYTFSYDSGTIEIDDNAFADSVYSYVPGADVGSGWNDPDAAIGAPDWSGTGDNTAVSLGDEGVLILQFTDNSLTTSGDNAWDLWVFEIGGATEWMNVAISTNATDWIDLGDVLGQPTGIDIDAISGVVEGARYSYVRISDIPPNQTGYPYGEADIDAVAALSSAAPVPEPATFILLGSGLAGLAFYRRKRK